MNYKLFCILVLAFLTAVFIFQNASEIDVKFLIWSVHMSQVLLMAIIFAIGILLGLLFSSYLRLRNRHSEKRHKPELDKGDSVTPEGAAKSVEHADRHAKKDETGAG